MFDINGKVALVTGGASGIGLETAKELLKNGARGVTIADIQEDIGQEVAKDLETEFGTGKVIFVKTDVCNKSDVEDAFKETISKFKNVDILINNAGIFNDYNYEMEIAINMTGMTHGLVLGLTKYILNHKSGEEGVILNVSSIAGTQACASLPIYSGTKFAIMGMTMNFGHKLHYDRTHIKVVAIAPGVTSTPLIPKMLDITSFKYLSKDFAEVAANTLSTAPIQDVSNVANGIINIIKEKESGTIWISNEGKDLVKYEHSLPPFEG